MVSQEKNEVCVHNWQYICRYSINNIHNVMATKVPYYMSNTYISQIPNTAVGHLGQRSAIWHLVTL